MFCLWSKWPHRKFNVEFKKKLIPGHPIPFIIKNYSWNGKGILVCDENLFKMHFSMQYNVCCFLWVLIQAWSCNKKIFFIHFYRLRLINYKYRIVFYVRVYVWGKRKFTVICRSQKKISIVFFSYLLFLNMVFFIRIGFNIQFLLFLTDFFVNIEPATGGRFGYWMLNPVANFTYIISL